MKCSTTYRVESEASRNKHSRKWVSDEFSQYNIGEFLKTLSNTLHIGVNMDKLMKIKTVQEQLNEITDTVPPTDDEYPPKTPLSEEIATLEFMVVTSELFVELFMNKKFNINRANLDNIKKFVFYRLNYFEKWHKVHMIRRAGMDAKSWDRRFLAKETYLNLWVAFRGFIGYAEYILETIPSIQYVAVLQGN